MDGSVATMGASVICAGTSVATGFTGTLHADKITDMPATIEIKTKNRFISFSSKKPCKKL
jgi:hypothetical protein